MKLEIRDVIISKWVEICDNMKMRIIFIGIIVLIIGLLFYYYNSSQNLKMTHEVKMILSFDDMDKKIFVNGKSWGISGNHEKITLSEREKTVPDKNMDYIFYTSEIFYKMESGGRLIIYAPKDAVSEPFKKFKDVVVVIDRLTTAEEIKEYNKHFRKYGLKKISMSYTEKSEQVIPSK